MIKPAVLSGYMDLGGPCGSLTEPIPVVVQADWIYAFPLRAILAIAGTDIHAVVSSPRVASEIRLLWKTAKSAARLREEHERSAERETLAWQRSLGCPV